VRVAVVGATGSLGTELLAVLDESPLAIRELVPIASEHSLGIDVEFRGGVFPVETELSALRGCDFAFLCAPPAVSLEAVRALLLARIAAIDCSGALAVAPEVPLVAELGEPGSVSRDAPMIAVPPGLSLASTRVLAPLAREFGISRAVATLLISASASGAGRTAVAALAEETIALLSQQEMPDPPSLDVPIAFDVLPWIGAIGDDGATDHERSFAAVLQRALGDAAIAVTSVRIPTFCGDGAAVTIELRAPAPLESVLDVLGKTPGVVIAEAGPTTRAAAGSDLVQVGRVRREDSRGAGVALWLAADGVRLTAAHAVRVAEARFGRG
jgi:aspartate-semialdehyde dehydrogenase